MEAGDLHDPGHLFGPGHGDGTEPFPPQQVLDEMREAVQRLRRQLQAGVPKPPAVTPDEQVPPDDGVGVGGSGG